MKLENIIIPTGVARAGMKVREGFEECLRCRVPGIAFVDETGQVAGIFSIRETLRRAYISDVMVNYADLLGNIQSCLEIPEEHARQVLDLPLEKFYQGKADRYGSCHSRGTHGEAFHQLPPRS